MSESEWGDSDAPGVLAVAEAAARVGIPVPTLRSWERRYGLGASVRTDGGHRRYSAADLQTLLRARALIQSGMATSAAIVRALEVRRPDDTAPPKNRDAQQAFVTAVDRLDPAPAARAANSILQRLGVVRAWDEFFAPHLQQRGRTWERTRHGVEQEHLAAGVLQAALARYTLNRPTPEILVLAAATAEEAHTLPLYALAAALAERKTGVCVLGTLPAASLRTAIERRRPDVLVLWTRTRHKGDAAALRGVLDRAPAICAAGPGWNVGRLPAGVGHAHDLTSAVDTVLAWTR